VSDIYDIPVNTLQGTPSSLGEYKGKALLVVNVASKCGLTPQYTGLQKLQDTYGDRGFSVLGFPCNQFLEQEPGSADEIAQFCTVNYGVTFPLFEKIEVNGPGRHPIYDELTATADN
jgi:glutathione peroxidase